MYSYLKLKFLISNLVWSTKSVVLWLRSHGYTPLEYQHMMPQEILIEQEESQDNSDTFHYINSFTPVNRLLSLRESDINDSNKLKDLDKETDEQNMFIDVVGECDEKIPQKRKLENEDTSCNDFVYHGSLPDLNEKSHVEMCSGSKYVKEQIDLVKTHFLLLKLFLVFSNVFKF